MSSGALESQLNDLGRMFMPYRLRPRQNGKMGKVPYNARDQPADSTDPENWLSFQTAQRTVQVGQFDGIGICLSPDGPVAPIDLDRMIIGGRVQSTAEKIIADVGTYTEISPSGMGLHLLALGKPIINPAKVSFSDGSSLETGLRFLTLTQAHMPGTPNRLEARQEQLDALQREMIGIRSQAQTQGILAPVSAPSLMQTFGPTDEQMLKKAFRAKNAANFKALWYGQWQQAYPSQSEGDLALARHITWWVIAFTAPDELPVRIDRLFRQSSMVRPKWEQRQDYRTATVTKAIAHVVGLGSFYGSQPIRLLSAPKETKEQQAIRWLKDLLTTGPRLASDVFQLAEDAGFPKPTLNRAKAKLSAIRSYQQPVRVWWWSLCAKSDYQILHKHTGVQGECPTSRSDHAGEMLKRFEGLYRTAQAGKLPPDSVMILPGIYAVDPAGSILHRFRECERLLHKKSAGNIQQVQENLIALQALNAWWNTKYRTSKGDKTKT